MSLSSGTLLLSMAVETPGVLVESGSVVTAMSKGDLEMSNVGGAVKVITLNGKVKVALAANPSDRRSLRAGQMVAVPAGATSIPPVTAIKLSTLLKTSILFNMGPLPSSRAIRQNATSQAPPRPFVTGGFDPDWGGGGIIGATSLGPAGTMAMVGRIEQNVVVPPPVLAPNVIPTQAQIVEFEAAGVAVPRSNQRAIEQNRGRPATVPGQTPRPIPVATPRPPGGGVTPPIATPRPFPTRPLRPGNPLPIPRPTLRPPIAPP